MTQLGLKFKTLLLIIIMLSWLSCKQQGLASLQDGTEKSTAEQNPQVIKLMDDYNVTGAGIGYIENRKLVKTEYYGISCIFKWWSRSFDAA